MTGVSCLVYESTPRLASSPVYGAKDDESMPGQFLLGRFPFTGEDGELPSEEYEVPEESSWLGSVTLPESYFAIMGEGPFFSDSGVPINVPQVFVEEWISTNGQPMHWWIYRHWLYVYDPYLITNAVADKCARTVRESALASSGVLHYKTPTSFFNGFDFTEATYTGGILPELDNTGALVSPGADKPSIRGARLATTVGDGAVVSNVELLPLLNFTGFVINSEPGSNVTSGVLNLINTAATHSVAYKGSTLNVGNTYVVEYTVSSISNGGVSLQSKTEGIIPTVHGAGQFSRTFVARDSVLEVRALTGTTASLTSISLREVIPTYYDTDINGNPLNPESTQPTRTGNAGFTAFTNGRTWKDYNPTDPGNWGWLSCPARTNYALNSAAPATQTVASLAIGTYTLWQEGTGSVVATAGTAVGTFGTASNGTPATLTITTAGTVVLTVSGTNTWLQLELGAFKTNRIATTTTTISRAGTVASYPTSGVIRDNNMAFRMVVVPRASGQSEVYAFSSYSSSNDYCILYVHPSTIWVAIRKSGVATTQNISYTHAKDVPIEIIVFYSSVGMRIAVRSYSGGAWSAWSIGSLNSTTEAKSSVPISSTFQLGALNSANQFYGNILEFEPLMIPPGTANPMTWAMNAYGVA